MLCVAVFAMFLWQAPTVLGHTAELLYLLLPLGVFFLVLPVLATLSAMALKLPGPQRVTLTMVTVARNSPIALGIAVVAFPDRPLIALALVLGPLVELPVLAVLSQVLRHRKRRTLDGAGIPVSGVEISHAVIPLTTTGLRPHTGMQVPGCR